MTIRWRGGAAAISWVLYVVPGNVSAGNEFSLTLDNKTITYLTTLGTVADVIAGLATAMAAAGVPAEWLDATGAAGASGTYLQLTPTIPGTVIGTITASAAIGSGTTAPTLTCSSTLATPVNATFGTAGTGGSLSNGTYYYRVSAINAVGETLASTETSKVLSGGTSTQTVVVNWTQVPGAAGYRIYGRSTGAEQFIAGVTGETTLTYTDLGSISPTGALPTANTTGVSGQGPFDFNTPGNWDASRVPQGAVSAPSGLGSALALGGSLVNGTTYYYKITATNANGETTASNETSQTADGTHGTVNLSWTATPFAQGYNVYRGTSTGAENKLIGTITSGATVAFTDNGIAGSSVSPPGGNTAVGDDVVLSSVSYDCLYNLNQGYPLYNSLTLDMSMQAGNNGQGCIGLPEQSVFGYVEYRPTYLEISPASFIIGNGNGAGATRWKLDFGTNPFTGLVNGTGSGDSGAGLEALLIKGSNASNALTVNKGLVGIAVFAGETAELATLNVNFQENVQSDAQVRCGAGVTLATVVQGGGQLDVSSAITTYTQDNGEAWHRIGAIATTILEGGILHENAPGNCMTSAVTVFGGAFLDMSEDPRAKTITPKITFYTGAKYRDPLGRVTLSGGYTIPNGSANACDLDFGPNRNYTAA